MGTVLIVDGDIAFAEAAQHALERAGHVVHVLDDAPIGELRRLRPSVLLVSVELPQSSFRGFSICSRIRRDKEFAALPILLTTSEARDEAFRRHRESADRADDYVQKPVDLEDIVQRVARLIPDGANGVAAEPRSAGAAGRSAGAMSSPESFGKNHAPPPLKDGPPRLPTSNVATRQQHDFEHAASDEEVPTAPAQNDASADLEPEETFAPAASAGMPRIPPVPPRNDDPHAPIPEPGEFWPASQFDQELKDALDIDEPHPPSKRKPTPEERVTYLRELVNHYKAKDLALQNIWRFLQERGGELERRIILLEGERRAQKISLTETQNAREEALRQRQDIEKSFREFDDQVRSIFAEKDIEQRALLEERDQLSRSVVALTTELEASKQRHLDDERRLSLIQEDLEALSSIKDDAVKQAQDAYDHRDKSERENEELKARLEMTEAVAAERADEVAHLRDQLDSLMIQADMDRRRVEQDRDEQIASMKAMHLEEIESLTTDHQIKVVALESAHEEIVNDLRQALATAEQEAIDQAAELRAQMDSERRQFAENHRQEMANAAAAHQKAFSSLEDQKNKAVEALKGEAERAARSEQARAATERALTQEIGALKAEIASLEEEKNLTSTALLAEREQREALELRRKDLEDQVADLGDDIGLSRKRLEETELMLETERTERKKERDKLEVELATTKAASEERITELEIDFEAMQTELFEKLAELDHQRKAAHTLETRASDLETARKLAERNLRNLETQLTHLNGQLAETEAALTQATDRSLSLETELVGARESERELTDALASARGLIKDLEAGLNTHRAELQQTKEARDRAEAEIADLQRTKADLEERNQNAVAKLAELENKSLEDLAELEAARGEVDRLGSALEKASHAFQREQDTRKRLEAEAEQLRQVVQHRDEAIASQLERMQSVQEELDEKVLEVEQLGARLGRSQESAEAAKRSARDLTARLEEAEGDAANLRLRVSSLEADLNEVRASHEEALGRSSELDTRLVRADVALQQAKESIRQLETKLFGSTKAMDEARVHQEELTNLLKEKDKHASLLERKVRELEETRRQNELALMEDQTQIEALKQESTRLFDLMSHRSRSAARAIRALEAGLSFLSQEAEPFGSEVIRFLSDNIETSARSIADDTSNEVADASYDADADADAALEARAEAEAEPNTNGRSEAEVNGHREDQDQDQDQDQDEDEDEDDGVLIMDDEISIVALEDLDELDLQELDDNDSERLIGRAPAPSTNPQQRPFAALVAEINSAVGDAGVEAFDDEQAESPFDVRTRAPAAFDALGSAGLPEEKEEDERRVTEIIDLHRLDKSKK